MHKFRFLSLFTLLLLLNISLLAQTGLKNSGFESVQNNIPEGWITESAVSSKCSVDISVSHSGKNSLVINHDNMNKSVVYSSDINLELGKLYKLSGWIKTENAFTDETAQYPTPVPACIRMESMPFTMHSQAAGATNDWQYIEILFFATRSKDRISLNFGYNGLTKGKAWFDDLTIQQIDNFADYVPQEKIKRYRQAFRFEEKGWIYVHVEGEPYNRGFQFGYLTANEIKTFINKLAISYNKDNPSLAWRTLRSQVDMIFLRKYENEYITEMKGIADGANKNSATVFDRPIDLLDIVTINSYIDLSYAADGITKTPNQLTGKRFDSPEEQMDMPDRLHKCSGLLANKSATIDGRVVFAQLFMWNGYMGPDWNVILDVVPDKGNRLVYETFPGGIHSGTDFYINSKGIILGETTVGQTPFNSEGTPQSNRIRLAAQYANNIDDAVKYLTQKNNGLYTNDWLMADTKNDEIAILLLGTNKSKLWRSTKNEFYGNQKDWYWSNNNTKDLEVRKEYIVNTDNAPYDLTFRPWDRDMTFWNFYETNKGKIDIKTCMDLMNSSPVNRPHACDGKITNSDMAEKLMFFAHYGKVTLREQFIGENGRIPDQPLAIPRLSLGYSTFSPITTAEMIKKLPSMPEVSIKEIKNEISGIEPFYQYSKDQLWQNTIFPASDKENWLISATAGYWYMMNGLPKDKIKAVKYLQNELSELNCRLLYTEAREGALIPDEAGTVYNVSKHYYIPKIKGTFLLHQLRLLLGNEKFSKMMNDIHDKYNSKNITNSNFIELAEKSTGEKLKDFISQWISRDDIPSIKSNYVVNKTENGWKVVMSVSQSGKPYHLISLVAINTKESTTFKKIVIEKTEQEFTFDVSSELTEVIMNPGVDFPVNNNNYFTFTNFYDDFSKTIIVYGTTREIEANHTLALRFQKTAADRFTEILLPVKKDCEVTEEMLKNNDFILMGGAYDNGLVKSIAAKSGLKLGNSFFTWKGKTYSNSNDGIMIVLPSPYNQNKIVTLIISNSALQLYQMCKNFPRIPSYALFKDDLIVDRGYHEFGQKTAIK
jgi:hypothetical protein